MINQKTKEQIKKELDKHVSVSGSQNVTIARLKVSAGYVSNIRKGEFEGISDNMWRKISRRLGMSLYEEWEHAPTKPALKIESFFDDARTFGNVFGMVGKPGSGKTDALDYFHKEYTNVFYVKAEADMPKRMLLRELLLTTGYTPTNGADLTLLRILRQRVEVLDKPLIILDELETVKNRELMIIKDLYNALWKRCGIVVLGTPNLKNRIENGVSRGYLGFNEILSRLGGKFIEIPAPDDDDAALVINTNGVTAHCGGRYH